MKFLKFTVVLAIVMLLVIAAYQVAEYWLGLPYYPFVSSVFLAFVHSVLLGGLAWSAYTVATKYKV